MGLFGFLSKSENTTAVQDISQNVLDVVADEDEVEESSSFISILIDMMRKDEEFTEDIYDEAGADVLIIVIVPAVAVALGYLLTKFGVESVDALKKRLQTMPNPQNLIQITADDIKAGINRTGLPPGKQNINKITEAVNKTVAVYLLK